MEESEGWGEGKEEEGEGERGCKYELLDPIMIEVYRLDSHLSNMPTVVYLKC